MSYITNIHLVYDLANLEGLNTALIQDLTLRYFTCCRLGDGGK